MRPFYLPKPCGEQKAKRSLQSCHGRREGFEREDAAGGQDLLLLQVSPARSAHARRATVRARCTREKSAKRRIYMFFMLRQGWHCQFLEEDLKTPLPRKIEFKEEAKLFELAERGGYSMNLEGRQAMEHAISNGRGGIWLELNEEQYAKLKKTADTR